MKNCEKDQLKIANEFLKIEKTAASQAYFSFTNMGSNMYHFSATAIFFFDCFQHPVVISETSIIVSQSQHSSILDSELTILRGLLT